MNKLLNRTLTMARYEAGDYYRGEQGVSEAPWDWNEGRWWKEWVRVQRQVVNKEQRGREGVIHCWVPSPLKGPVCSASSLKWDGRDEHGGWEGSIFREQHINSTHRLNWNWNRLLSGPSLLPKSVQSGDGIFCQAWGTDPDLETGQVQAHPITHHFNFHA